MNENWNGLGGNIIIEGRIGLAAIAKAIKSNTTLTKERNVNPSISISFLNYEIVYMVIWESQKYQLQC